MLVEKKKVGDQGAPTVLLDELAVAGETAASNRLSKTVVLMQTVASYDFPFGWSAAQMRPALSEGKRFADPLDAIFPTADYEAQAL